MREARLRAMLKRICEGAQQNDDFVVTRGWLLMVASMVGLDIEKDIMSVTDDEFRKEIERLDKEGD